LLAPVTRWSATLTPENADAVMREAIDRAMTEPRGPVHLECPSDVLSACDPTYGEPVVPVGATRGREHSDAAEDRLEHLALIDPASLAPILSGARRPLLLVGLGARRPLDAEAIVALCARRGVPAMVTYKAKGVVPDAHRFLAFHQRRAQRLPDRGRRSPARHRPRSGRADPAPVDLRAAHRPHRSLRG
jgi:thiamine pyrophosphate-dependent acetolactate synthase large subunit-like protein